MSAAGFIRTVVLVAVAAAIICSGAVTGCSKQKPGETTPSSAPSVFPTEKFF